MKREYGPKKALTRGAKKVVQINLKIDMLCHIK